jgi:spore germination protein YaaH
MMSLTSSDLKTWQVEYNATYWVEATSEDEAIDLAMEKHADLPDGDWNAMIDPYDSNNFNTLGEK